MPAICLTFLVQLPNRLKHYSFFDIGESSAYEDNVRTFEFLEQAATESLLPANRILLRRLKEYRGDFRIAFSLSGIVLEELERFKPEVLDSFKAIADTGHVEFITEPYYHSLASVTCLQEFREQVMLHQEKIRTLFGHTSTSFRNTGLIHSDAIALEVEKLDYTVALIGGGAPLHGKKNPGRIYRPGSCKNLRLLINHHALNQDVLLRFTNRDWPEYPLSASQYAHWIKRNQAPDDMIHLTLDLARFMGRNHPGTGLCEFLDQFPETVLLHSTSRFQTPTQAAQSAVRVSPMETPSVISGEPPDHDLSSWMGNEMQKDSIDALYLLEPKVKGLNNPLLLRTWRILQNADHFLCMNTHTDPLAPANPYGSPYDAYINFMNVLTDFIEHVEG